MVQVVTNENMQQFIETRQVPEFKAPEPPKAVVAPDATKAAEPAVDAGKALARDDSGKFVKTDEVKKDDTAAAAADDDDDTSKLSESVQRKIERIIGKKHKAMKEAEEFGRDEYRERRAAVERADALQRELDALKGTKSGNGTASSEGDEPKPEDFKTVGEYTKELTKYEVAQARKADSANAAKQNQKQQIETVQQQFAERIAATAKEIPDYHEVVEAADWEVPHHMQAYFVDSENGARLGYELAKDRAQFDRIAKLSPIRALAELGKLEDKLFAKKADATSDKGVPAASTQVSRAPAPITPLEGKSTTVAKDPSQMSFAELRAHRLAERTAGKNR
jgi:hypothetical protein